MTLAAAVLAGAYLRRVPHSLGTIRATLPLPEKTILQDLALSPDGTRLAFTAFKAGAQAALFLRRLDGSLAQPVPGAENAWLPFWSPDGRNIGFFTDGKLNRLDVSGGAILTVCDAEFGAGGSWNRDGTIVFASNRTGALSRVSAAGGQPVPVTKLDASRGETSHRYPQFLPDGRHFLYMAANLSAAPNDPSNSIRVGLVDGKSDKKLVPLASGASYAAGRLFYVRDRTLLAQDLDLSSFETRGEPTPLAQRLDTYGWAFLFPFSVSENGILVVAPAFLTPSRLVWFDRSGREIGSVGETGLIDHPRLSPDGRRVAADRYDPGRDAAEIWIYDASGGSGTKFVFSGAHDDRPVWSPDGTRLVFSSDRKAKGARGDLWIKPLDGGKEEILSESPDDRQSDDWSRDGRFLSFSGWLASGRRNHPMWILDMAGSRRVSVFAEDSEWQGRGRFSPDSRWIAYASDESGRFEVYVRAFPGPGGKWQVSTAGGGFPVWRRDGKELFYLGLDNKLMAVPISVDGAFHAGSPVSLFAAHPPSVSGTPYDISPDGLRFLVNTAPADQGSPPLELVVNWTALLPKN